MVVNKRIAFLFPGQGAQYPQMALDLYQQSTAVQELFALASEAAGIDLTGLLEKASPEELKRTDSASYHKPGEPGRRLGAA